MKTMVEIDLSPDDFNHPSQYEQVASLAVGHVNRIGDILIRLPESDPVVINVQSRLHTFGMVPWLEKDRDRLPGEYSTATYVVWEKIDWDAAPLLIATPQLSISGLLKDPEPEVLELNVEFTNMENVDYETQCHLFESSLIMVGKPWSSTTIVNDALRRMMLKEGFKPLRFLDKVRVVGSERRRIRGKPWVLSSDLILPPVSKNNKFIDREGKPFTGDHEKGCFLAEGSKLSYAEGALRNVGSFDLAFMRERLTGSTRAIVSQKFRRFCDQHALSLLWEPVDVIPDTEPDDPPVLL